MNQTAKKTVAIIYLVFCTLSVVSCTPPATDTNAAENTPVERKYGSDLDRVLMGKMAVIKTFVKEPSTIEEVQRANQKRTSMTLHEIQEVDSKWMSKNASHTLVNEHLNAPCSQALKRFQQANPGFSEIFITDSKGLIVCLTNKTSDYYQADEQWWVTGFNLGTGKSYYGTIEYDESAHSQSIPVYVPVINPKTNDAVGVCKAVIDISAIKEVL